MIAYILIIVCSTVLIGFIIDVLSSKIKVPSVVPLLLFGFSLKWFLQVLNLPVPDTSKVLPFVGTIGLVLIVLEGALELKINQDKIVLIKKAFWISLVGIVVMTIVTTSVCVYIFNYPIHDTITNVLPLCIISSAIAIPSAKAFAENDREFIVYESSFSDIFGVVLFNFFAFTEVINYMSGIFFIKDILVIRLITIIGTVISAIVLYRISTSVKHVPLLALILLIYAITKLLHLPGLIFILMLGLIFSNANLLHHIKWFKKIQFETFNIEVHDFTALVIEATFLMRILFFVMFGFTISPVEIIDVTVLPFSIGIVILIFLSRFILLRINKTKVLPVLFVAPRGLINILLFITIPASSKLTTINNALVIQLVLLTALTLILGSALSKKSAPIAFTSK
jgi:cell volume regulation protein A